MRRSGLFLIELVLALLFFSLTSAVCMEIFGTSAVLSRQQKNRDAAIEASVCAAECLKVSGGDLRKTAEALRNGAEYEEGIGIRQPCGDDLMLNVTLIEDNAEYVVCTLLVTDAEGKSVHTMEVSALKATGGAA